MTEKQEKPFEAFVEHQRKALEEASKAVEALLPPEFKEHSRAALNESIEGFRVLINFVLDEIKEGVNRESTAEEPPKSTTGKSKVKVELN